MESGDGTGSEIQLPTGEGRGEHAPSDTQEGLEHRPHSLGVRPFHGGHVCCGAAAPGPGEPLAVLSHSSGGRSHLIWKVTVLRFPTWTIGFRDPSESQM